MYERPLSFCGAPLFTSMVVERAPLPLTPIVTHVYTTCSWTVLEIRAYPRTKTEGYSSNPHAEASRRSTCRPGPGAFRLLSSDRRRVPVHFWEGGRTKLSILNVFPPFGVSLLHLGFLLSFLLGYLLGLIPFFLAACCRSLIHFSLTAWFAGDLSLAQSEESPLGLG